MNKWIGWVIFATLGALALAGPLVLSRLAFADQDAAVSSTSLPAGTHAVDPGTGKGVVVATPAAAPGGAAPMPETTVGDVVAAARAGKWLVAIAGALILLVAFLRFLAGKLKLSFFQTDRGGAVLVGLTALATVLGATAAAPGAHFDTSTLGAIAAATWSAAGGYTWLKSIFSPRDQKVTPQA